jgi:hypothetical protein
MGKVKHDLMAVVKIITICSALAFIVGSFIENYMEVKYNDAVLKDANDV